MTKEEVDKYIKDKQIPLSFVWKNNLQYYLCLHIDGYGTFCDRPNIANKSYNYPIWGKTNCSNYISYNDDSQYNTNIFKSETRIFEKELSDFLFWFELNKHKCKSITYYKG